MISRRKFIKSALASSAALQLSACVITTDRQHINAAQAFKKANKPNSERGVISHQYQVNVLDYGAKGDGITLDTHAIQQAIDTAATAGGGIVIIPQGRYLIGSLYFKSNVALKLNKGALLLGSISIYHYLRDNKINALISADGCHNIAIFGEGEIDGRGRELALAIDYLLPAGERLDENYNERRRRPRGRPELLFIANSNGIKLYDIVIKNSASWVQHFKSSENITIDNISVQSDSYWNNDGIDINDCRKVSITNCYVNAADDAICLKSKSKGSFFNEDVYIANCLLRSSSNGVKFGTESQGGFKNIRVENITVYDTYRAAIALETVDGAIMENVTVDNITARNVGCAIFVRLGQRNKDVAESTPVGTIRNIQISNIYAEVAFGRADSDYDVRGPALNKFFNPIPASICGLPEAHIEDIKLENITISYPGRGNTGIAYVPLEQLFLVPEERAGYPEYTMFGELPAWGLYVRHVSGLNINNITLTARHPDFRPAFVFDDVNTLTLSAANVNEKLPRKALTLPLQQQPVTKIKQHIILHNVTGDVITKCVLSDGSILKAVKV